MKTYRQMVRAGAAVFLAAAGMSTASALSFKLDGATGEFSGSGQTFTGYILATFSDTAANQVTLTLDSTKMTAPVGAKIDSFYFNYLSPNDPTGVSKSNGSPFQVDYANFSSGTDDFKADGDGWFDFKLDFPASGNTFTLNETVTIILTGTGLTASKFNDISVNGPAGKNGFYVAAHVQAISNGGSGWFKGTTWEPIPSPDSGTTIAMLGLGLVGLSFYRRKA